MLQQSLFSDGNFLKTEGIATAAINADLHTPQWNEKALQYLESYLYILAKGRTFLAEDVRKMAEQSQVVPLPPSKRAWGGILVKARNKGLIVAIGTQPVKNPQAHCVNATVWMKL